MALCGKSVVLGQYLARKLTSSELPWQFLVKFEDSRQPRKFWRGHSSFIFKRGKFELIFFCCDYKSPDDLEEEKKVVKNFDDLKKGHQ